jgi:hypothetical protein
MAFHASYQPRGWAENISEQLGRQLPKINRGVGGRCWRRPATIGKIHPIRSSFCRDGLTSVAFDRPRNGVYPAGKYIGVALWAPAESSKVQHKMAGRGLTEIGVPKS